MLFILLGLAALPVRAEDRLRMSTTTSTENSGLLSVLRQGDRNLWNPYGVIAVNPKKHAHVKYDLAMKLVDFVTGPEGRSLIAGF